MAGTAGSIEHDAGGFMVINPIEVLAGDIVSTNVPEDAVPVYAAGVTYALGDQALWINGNDHWVIESRVDNNQGNAPTGDNETDPNWLFVSVTNRLKAFSQKLSVATSNADSITYQIRLDGLVNAIQFFGVVAESVKVCVIDDVGGELFNQTYEMRSSDGISDYWEWFYLPIESTSRLTILDIPNVFQPLLEITIASTGATASVGAIIPGVAERLGDTKRGLQLGIRDYSVDQPDAFGDFDIVERGYSRVGDMQVEIDTAKLDYVFDFFVEARAKPRVYISAGQFKSSIIYGFYSDFRITIQYPNYAVCSLSLLGLS